MKPALQQLRTRATWLALLAALCLAPVGAAPADEKKDKAPDKKAVDPKKDAKADGKEAPVVVTNTLPILITFPKSVFNTTLEAGKDPFFPASKRRFPKAPVVVEPVKPPPVPATTNPTVVIQVGTTNPPPAVATTNTNPVPVVPPPTLIGSANLRLLGIVGSKLRPRASIHTGVKSYDFLKGEEMLIRLPNDKTLKVRCLDIKDRSASFQAEGEPDIKEIFLREGL